MGKDPSDPDINELRKSKKREVPKRRTQLVTARLHELRLELSTAPLSDSQVTEKFATKWKVGERQIRMYLHDLRDEMKQDYAARAPTLREEMINQVKSFYAVCMAEGPRSRAAAGRAQDRLILLQGLAAPQRIELTGRDGAPMQMVAPKDYSGYTDEELRIAGKVLGLTDEEMTTH